MRALLLLALLCLFSLTTTAQLPNYSVSQEVDQSIEQISAEEVQSLKSDKRFNCHAYTSCSNGRFIECYTYGQGCTFYTQPYQYVQCTGYNQWGAWVNTNATCY